MSDFDLKGKRIADTYKGLLKLAVSGNGAVSSSLTQVEGGDGTNTALFVATDSVKVGGAFAVSSSVSVGGSLQVTGDVCASSYYGSGRHLTSVVATGDTSVSTLIVANTAEIGGALSVGGGVTLTGAVNLLSTATVSGAAGFLGTVRVSGNTSLGGTLDVAGTATFTNVDVDDINLNGKVFTVTGDTDDTFKITAGANGATTLETVDTAGAAADLTLDVDGIIKLDAGDSGGQVQIFGAGTKYGTIYHTGSGANLNIQSDISNGDIQLRGIDAGSNIIALTLDMSEGGTATFNDDIIIKDGGTIGSASDPDAIQIASDGVTTFSQGLTVSGGSDGDTLLTFSTDRAWAFLQSGDDGGTSLVLKSLVAGKIFNIVNASNGIDFQFFTNDGSGSPIPHFQLGQHAVIRFEGSTDDTNETVLTVVDPTADRTISLPNESGTIHTSGGSITIPDGGTIGSASDTDAITIAADGAVTFNSSATVDDINLNGKVLTITGDTGDTFKITAGANGATTIATVDAAGTSAHLTVDTDGLIILDSGGSEGITRFQNNGTLYGEVLNSGDNFYLRSQINNGDIILQGEDGGSFIDALRLDMSEAGLATFNDGATFNGDVTLTGAANNVVWDKSDNALEFADNAKAKFGNSDDLEIWHDGLNSNIKSGGAGSLIISSNFSQTGIVVVPSGKVSLYHNNAEKLQTTATGATVTGAIVADSATVDDISLDGKVLTITGDTGDTFTITAGTNGATTLATTDTAGADAFLRLDADGYTWVDSGNVIILDAGDTYGTVRFDSSGSAYGTIYENSDSLHLKSNISDANIFFQGNDGGSTITALTLDMSEAGKAIFNAGATFADDVTVEDINLSGKVLTITGDTGDTFKITAGTHGATTLATVDTAGALAELILDADGRIRLDAGDGYGVTHFANNGTNYASVHNSGTAFYINNLSSDGDTYIQGRDSSATAFTALRFDMSEAGKAIFNAGATFADAVTVEDISLDGKVLTITGDTGDTFKITTGGSGATTLSTIDTAGNDGRITLDADGYIELDSGGQYGQVFLDIGGVNYGEFFTGGTDFNIRANQDNQPMKFAGKDGGTYITALTLDMSAAGAATFNNDVNAAWGNDRYFRMYYDDSYHMGLHLEADTRDLILYSKAADGSGDIRFKTGSGPSEKMTLLADGKLGLGTITPLSNFEIHTDLNAMSGTNVDVSNLSQKIHNPQNDTGEAVGIGFGISTSGDNVGSAITFERTASESIGKLHLATKSTGAAGAADIPIRMTIDPDGNVGIGTTTPLKTLHVDGPALSTVKTLTDASTVASDFDVGQNFTLTLGGNRTLGAPSNVDAGQVGSIFIIQDGTGSRTLAYNSIWKFAGGTAPTLSTAAGAIDRLDYIVQSGTAIQAVLTKAYA